jgi:hypothetical protein
MDEGVPSVTPYSRHAHGATVKYAPRRGAASDRPAGFAVLNVNVFARNGRGTVRSVRFPHRHCCIPP